MKVNENLLNEFVVVRMKYNDLIRKVVREKIPGLVDPAQSCNCGSLCETGTAIQDEMPIVESPR